MTDMPAALPGAATATGQNPDHDLTVTGQRPVSIAATARALGLAERSLRRWAKRGTLADHLPDDWSVTTDEGKTTILAPPDALGMTESGPGHGAVMPVAGQGENRLREEITALRARVEELEGEAGAAAGREASLREQVGNLRERIAGLEASEAGLTGQLVEVRGERDNLRERLSAAERDREGLIARIPLALPERSSWWARLWGRGEASDRGRETS